MGRFLDFFDNWWFRVFEKQSESDNYRFWVVDKKIRIRERCVLVVSKASKNGERFTKNNCKIAGDFLGFRWLFQEYWGPWLISELGIWLFDEHDYMSKLEIWLFRPVTINPKNCPLLPRRGLVQILITAQHSSIIHLNFCQSIGSWHTEKIWSERSFIAFSILESGEEFVCK